MLHDKIQRDTIDPTKKDFDYESTPFYNMVRLTALYHQRVDASLKPIGMDSSRWRILIILTKMQQATITQLSKESVIKISTIAKIIQRMTADGLVETKTCTEDARSTKVFVTEYGAEKVEVMRGKVGKIVRQAYLDMDDEELAAINQITKAIHDNLSP